MRQRDSLVRVLIAEAVSAGYKHRFEDHARMQGYMVLGWEDDKLVIQDDYERMLWAYPGLNFTPYYGSKFNAAAREDFTTVTPREYD